jgi:sulfite reductase (NADPH) flavoprotein alpha-component
MPPEPAAASPYTRANPFPGKLAVNRSLCGADSVKDTRHFEIDLTGWGLNYEVGDSMTVWPTNDPALVDEIIRTLGAKGDEAVKSPSRETTLREALLRDCRITQTAPKFLKAVAERASAAPLLTDLLKPERKQELDTYLWGMEVIDFLIEHPSIKWAPQEFVDVLAKLQPRLYSISSSLKARPNQVHFTIDVVHYESRGRQRKGVCSTFHHGRAGDGDRAFPGLFAGAAGRRGKGKKLALLRIAAPALQLFLRRRIGCVQARWGSDAARLCLVPRSGRQILRAAQDAGECRGNLEMDGRRRRAILRLR